MKLLPLICLLALGWLPLHGEDAAPAAPAPEKATGPLPGHSVNGEAFDEGPRQAAVLMDGMGKVHFPVTTKNELAQRFFDQGIGQLHGFWYFEAERSFRQAAAIDPDCATAFWGMAMANINNQKRAADFIKKATVLKEKVSRREQLWIDSLAGYYAGSKKDEKQRREALVQALEEIAYEFPDDLEAKAFLVFQIWDNKGHGMPLESRTALEALGKQVLAVNPMHPGVHHYFIHLWNSPNSDKHSLPSAALDGQAAPGIAHLWHMPGHTFSNLHRYADAAWQQEASARVDHAYMISSHVMPDQIHNFAHNNDWLVKNLGYVGRVHDAVELAKNMIELPRIGSKAGQSYKMGRERLLETLTQFELWSELEAAGDTMYLAPFDDATEEIGRRRALGVAWFSTKNFQRGQTELEALKATLAKSRADRLAAGDRAEAEATKAKKTEDETTNAMAAAMRGFAYRIDSVQSAIAEVRLARALANGDIAAAKTQLDLVKDLPAFRRARMRFEVGEIDEALKLGRDASSADEAQTRPLASLAELLWRAGKNDEALAAFDKLRKLSAQVDLDVPVFSRLAPLAEARKLPADWRVNYQTADDAGTRPDLSTLGPFRWHPSLAPAWTLPDSENKPVSLADFKGQPLLVVFYLGSGCAKCIEQLNAFAPIEKQFATAGIRMIAVGTEPVEGLQKTFAKAKDGVGFPFPILSDADLTTFKAYRAFDDFEHIPLHGAFLIDAAGLVRWQDISYEPFKDAPWLLGEAKRLLSVAVAPPAVVAR